MDLSALINCLPDRPVISIAGAGGKTTLMFRLAEMLPGRCVMTTTTKVAFEQVQSVDVCCTLEDFPGCGEGKKIWASPSLEPVEGKIHGCSFPEFSQLTALCAAEGFPLMNEADGAHCRHIKAPAAHEPMIPPESTVCIYGTGLDVLGKPVDGETVHRPEIFTELTGAQPGELIQPEHVLRLLEHPQGGLKGFPPDALKIVYLNHADTPERKAAGEWICERLQSYDHFCIND